MSRGDPPPPETAGPVPPPSPGRRRSIAVILAGALLLILAAGGAGYRFLQAEFARPADPGKTAPVLVEVRSGMGLRQVARMLGGRGIIRSPALFRIQARLRGGAKRIHSGFYEFSPSMSPRRIFRALIEGRVAQRTFTIPEGFALKEIAQAIGRTGLASPQDILALARDRAVLSELKVSADSLEGYLFPDTYRFPLGTSPRRLLRTMVKNMRDKLSPALRERAERRGLTIHQALTLASIIEKETAVAAERTLIAAVFLNRLRRNMRLQSDPTVIYGLPAFDGNLHKKDLSYDSPYNTYLHKGLPPGPIASPGLASIRAALYPADVDYLYFVATQEGGHQFSRTYIEHRRAIDRFQRGVRRKVDP